MGKVINQEFYYSPTEAGKYLGISNTTLKRWAEQGRIAVGFVSGSSQKMHEDFEIEFIRTIAGYRYYRGKSIEKLRERLTKLNYIMR